MANNWLEELAVHGTGLDRITTLALAVALMAALYVTLPRDRMTLRRYGIFFLVCWLVQPLTGQLDQLDLPMGSSVLHEALTLGTGMVLIKLLGLLLFRVVLRALRLELPRILEDVSVFVFYIAFGLVRMRVAGVELGHIITTSAVITAVIGFSMQDTLGNVLSGLALQLDHSLDIGDWIKVGETVGKVSEIRWRSTRIETNDLETVVIPNSILMKNDFILLGKQGDLPAPVRRWVHFNSSLSAQPHRVISIVEKTLRDANIPFVARDPAPSCVLVDFDHGTGRYAVRYWLTDMTQDTPADSSIRVHVFNALQRAGLRIAIHEYHLYTSTNDYKDTSILKREELKRRLDALRHIDLFARMEPDELNLVAEQLVYAPFAAGDVISRQGAVAHWLYIIKAGSAEIWRESEQGRRRVGELKEGSFFGEMGLLTGAPRSATLIAITDVECYRLHKSALEEILTARPELAAELSEVIAERAREHADEPAGGYNPQATMQSSELLAKIKRFFSLT
ncbi:mechanosensitive ion channel family protein [Chitinivorax sp. PXF-14]|uniref:cyclic nucleotide-binding domain-containing protein n=1 Tax=Chitinivorax sp. PXF-14 TaxID=3230488 RepID=UPI0034662F12